MVSLGFVRGSEEIVSADALCSLSAMKEHAIVHQVTERCYWVPSINLNGHPSEVFGNPRFYRKDGHQHVCFCWADDGWKSDGQLCKVCKNVEDILATGQSLPPIVFACEKAFLANVLGYKLY